MEELPLDHEPSLDHWARLIADGEKEEDDHSSDWDIGVVHTLRENGLIGYVSCEEYERAWHSLDAEYNYSYEYREGW